MTKLQDFLAGRLILEEAQSAINGKLTVVKEIAWGTHIMAGGITQSGGIAQDIWKRVFRHVAQKDFKSTLIIGLGGGGIAKLIAKNWPEAKITGVEIDPVIVKLGKKYLGLDKLNLKIILEDGVRFCNQEAAKKKTYDLICIDTYIGQNFPNKFQSVKFLKTIKSLVTRDGIVIFNRLYYQEKIQEAHLFQEKLEEIFPKVEVIKPEANIMFVCSHS